MKLRLPHGSLAKQVANDAVSNLIWILVPGGPGIESEYLIKFAETMRLPGRIITFDLPRGDQARKPSEAISFWQSDLLALVKAHKKPIIVGHSFGGMLTLSTGELASHCSGAVFLDSSPDNGWQQHASDAEKRISAPEASAADMELSQSPSDENFKNLCVAWAPFYFQPQSLSEGIKLLEATRYNHHVYVICSQFFEEFETRWPEVSIPTLCLAGDNDLITPLSLFRKHKLFHSNPHVTFAEITNAGHFPWIENPAEVRAVVEHFTLRVQTPLRA